jgi:class 3 adenylate cyclase
MPNVETALVKVIYLDIVRFTQDRSIEAQSELVSILNEIVRKAVDGRKSDYDAVIYLPTGDGMAVILLGAKPFDIHLEVALDILAGVTEHNNQTEDDMRKFEVRIGINQNEDNIVTDINEKRNVAGAGVNMAQRYMSLGDGGQIMLGSPVHEVLRVREKYMYGFEEFVGKDKHGNEFPVYQYVVGPAYKYIVEDIGTEDYPGLNVERPTAFRLGTDTKLTELVAYYLAHSLQNRAELLQLKPDIFLDDASIIALYFRAIDSYRQRHLTEYDTYSPRAYGGPDIGLTAQVKYYYEKSDYSVRSEFARRIKVDVLSDYVACFEMPPEVWRYIFASAYGTGKLKEDWPNIWDEFLLGKTGSPPAEGDEDTNTSAS